MRYISSLVVSYLIHIAYYIIPHYQSKNHIAQRIAAVDGIAEGRSTEFLTSIVLH